MAQKKVVLRGLREWGRILEDGTRQPFGLVAGETVTLSFDQEIVDVTSAQFDAPVALIRKFKGASMKGSILLPSLRMVALGLGLNIEGDLDAQEPTDETLEIIGGALGELGTSGFYLAGPGVGAGERLVVIHRGEAILDGDLGFGTEHKPLDLLVRSLANLEGGPDVTLTDAAA